MSKHTLPVDSDDNSEGENSSPKRARIRHSSGPPSSAPDSVHHSQPQPAATDRKPEGVANGRGEDDESESGASSDGDDELMDEEEDQAELAIQRDERTRLERDSQVVGAVAPAGVIEEIKLVDFMCHRHCTVNFGPQINFLVGNNGSGKSAVLTGITMALGGNARATNRATKGSGFVREGASYATCTVRLRNRGEDAYQSHVYGESITIERRIGGEGSSGGYRISNDEKKLVDTRKATLDAILDHLNIQVDNPMTVLTQDQSRQFLASATGKDKYNFFLRGTQLAALTEEYELIRANTETMEDTMIKKREIIPELKTAFKRAKERSTEARAALGQQDKLNGLTQELAWSFVAVIEDSIKQSEGVIDSARRKLAKITEAVNASKERLETAETELADLNEAQAEGANPEAKERELDQLKDQIKSLKAKMQDQNNQMRSTNATVKRMKESIASYDRELEEARRKAERDVAAEQAPIQTRLAEIGERVTEAGHEQIKCRISIDDADETRRENVDKLTTLRDQISRAGEAEDNIKRKIGHLEGAKRDTAARFGETMPQIMRAIEAERGWQRPPIGPLGQYVKIAPEHKAFAGVLESFFGDSLNAFLVDNERDKNLLNSILHRNRPQRGGKLPPITKQAHDPTFDFSRGVPSLDILTIHRALTFDGPFAQMVERALINGSRIEKAALVRERRAGDELMRNRPHNVDACFSSDGFRLSFDGGSSSTALPNWQGARRLAPDLAGQVEAAKAELAAAGDHTRRLRADKAALDQQLTNIASAAKAAQQRLDKLQRELRNLEAERSKLKDQLKNQEPPNIASIEDARNDAQAELDSTLAQFTSLNEAKEQTNREAQPLTLRRDDLTQELDQQRILQARIAERLNAAVAKVQTAKDNLAGYEAKLTSQEAQVRGFEEQLGALRATEVERTEQARHVCERPVVEKKKSPEKLEKEIETIRRVLADRERRHGASIDRIQEELAIRRRILDDAQKSLKEIGGLARALVAAYDSRVLTWTEFRDQISIRARAQFLFHLSKRGFAGKIHFHHQYARLDMRVQTEDIAGTKSRTKDTKSLSGGEKSFSTICLLLTMWDAVGCPIRCLDEFDVFMDAVNRRISMSMLIQTAKTAKNTQHILISPNDLGSLSWGPEVRCIRLQDPGRSQGTLGFGA